MNQLEHCLCFWDLACSILQKIKKHLAHLHWIHIGNPGLDNLKSLRVDMESAIYIGFKCHNQELSHLVSMRHLKKRDEEKMLKLLQKTNQSSAQKSPSKAEVLNDIYGERTGTHYEYGLAVVQYGRFQC